jgi:hypothetical protein|tara:strand:+ start:33 stop:233 length:201 start_codon:yes stop_codon:yes gene_type:complete
MTAESKVLRALRKRNRVTRRIAIEKGWAENLTATISRLRKMGHIIAAITAHTKEGETYTRYRLMSA